jgi:hypothetical protein
MAMERSTELPPAESEPNWDDLLNNPTAELPPTVFKQLTLPSGTDYLPAFLRRLLDRRASSR